jgi:hypothetical protein
MPLPKCAVHNGEEMPVVGSKRAMDVLMKSKATNWIAAPGTCKYHDQIGSK